MIPFVRVSSGRWYVAAGVVFGRVVKQPNVVRIASHKLQQILRILNASVWLPGDFDFGFTFPSIWEGQDVNVASTSRLLGELERLRAAPLRWRAPTPRPREMQ